jgi:uncharacterized protein YecE (DUF72 family)
VRAAVELRHPAWLTEERLDALAEAGAALVVDDVEHGAGGQPTRAHFGFPGPFEPERFVTAPFGYVRIIGDHADRRIPRDDFSKVRIDRTAETEWWAEALRLLLARVEPVYASVNRHFSGHAPHTLRVLAEKLGHAEALPPPGEEAGAQMKLPGV